MYEGQFSLVDVYVDDISVGSASLFQTWDGHITATLALNRMIVKGLETQDKMYESVFSFVDKFSRKHEGYYRYVSGAVQVCENSIIVTKATFKKSLVDVVEKPSFLYVGMGEDE